MKLQTVSHAEKTRLKAQVSRVAGYDEDSSEEATCFLVSVRCSEGLLRFFSVLKGCYRVVFRNVNLLYNMFCFG